MAEKVDYAALKKGGFMRQKQKGCFSLRLAVVGGNLTAENIKTVAEVAEKYGHGYVHMTSRQGIEIPFIKVEDINEVKEELTTIKDAISKLNSKATTAKGLENTVKVTASKLSANTNLEALKSDKTMEDSDKISVERSASLRIAKLADKTKGVTLKDGRYEGTKIAAKYGPDSTVKYKITVTNLGSYTATNLLVTEEPSEQLKEISKWGKFSQGSSVKTKNGKTAKVTVDGVTAVIDKLASKDSLELEFDVKLKKDATNAVNLNNSVSISGNYVVNGQEVAMTTTDLMSDKDAISIDKTVKPSGNEKKKNKNGKNGKNGKGTDSSKNGANGKGKTSNGTKTGDNSPIGLLLAIMVVCAGTAVVTVLFRRKER